MKNFSVDETNQLYECAKHCRTYKHIVYQPAFEKLCMAIRHIERDLGEQAEDDYWQELLRELKRFRFKLCAAPIPVNFLSIQLLALLDSNKKNCQKFFPSFVLKLQNIIDCVSDLVDISDNPLLEKISELILPSYASMAAILLKENYLFPMVEKVLVSHPVLKYVELVNKYQLRGAQCYQQLFVIWPHHQFPDYIIRAPRAKEIHYLRYSWIPDIWITKPIFIAPVISSIISDGNSTLVDTGNTVSKNTYEQSGNLELELEPEINWHKLSTKLLKQVMDDHIQEMVPARLYLLARDHAVFLEENEHTRILALDFETNEEEDEEVRQFRRIPVSQLQPGMFLLLRTEGGGDYIVPIANRILGQDAIRLREMQEHWKALLRKEVETKGPLSVCIDLLDLGGSNWVKEINLRYWISSRSIRPHDSDFSAIMSLIGLHDKEILYRDAADKIKTAHRRAGFHIRKLLIEQIATTALHEIHKKGYVEFELQHSDGGSLTAFRIEHIAPNISNVSSSRIGRHILAKDY